MANNILITGASGYLGGSLLADLPGAKLPDYGKLFALVRHEDQARKVRVYGATPLSIDLKDREAVKNAVVDNDIMVVFWLISAFDFGAQAGFIEGLAEVKRRTGREVDFLQTSGAKLFSSLTGHPNDEPLLDTNPELFEIQKNCETPYNMLKISAEMNCKVIEEGEKHGVRTYVFVPCAVYGKGTGFGNKISIQVVDIVKAAKATGRVYSVDAGQPQWPVCHISDNTSLYLQILRCIIEGKDIGHGKRGYYLASSGRVAWGDLYAAMARGLAKRGVIKDGEVVQADATTLDRMAEALQVNRDSVRIKVAGNSYFEAENGRRIGWEARYPPSHILAAAEEEVEHIMKALAEEELSLKAKV